MPCPQTAKLPVPMLLGTGRRCGLGLSIAKTIADAHRIKIQVESEYGSWICFVLTL